MPIPRVATSRNRFREQLILSLWALTTGVVMIAWLTGLIWVALWLGAALF